MGTAFTCQGQLTDADTNIGLDEGGVLKGYGLLPLSFEANRGQTDPQVKFLARTGGYTLFLTPTEAVLALGGVYCRNDRRE